MQMNGIIELNLSLNTFMLCIDTKVQTCWQKVIVIECSCLIKGFSFSFGNCACNYYNLCTTFAPRQLTKIYKTTKISGL